MLGTPCVAASLELATVVEGELGPDEVDVYELEMGAGVYAWVEVPACELDVSLTLRSPGGELIATADVKKRSRQLEELYWVSEQAGRHRIEVRASRAGRYEIKLHELRTERPDDRARIPAWRAYAEARELLLTRHELERAIALFESTLPTWRRLGDATEEASTLENLGTCHRRLERLPAAISFYEQAIPVWQRAGDRNAEANAWIGLGSAQQFLDQLPAARRSFESALALLEPDGNPKLRAVALNNLALIDKEQGQLETARARLQQAEALRRSTGDRAGQARTLVNLGSVLTYLGENAAAKAMLVQGITIAETLDDRPTLAAGFANQGVLAEWEGRPLDAIDWAHRSLAINVQLGDRAAQAEVQRNLGAAYLNLGDLERALAGFTAAHTINGELGRRADRAEALIDAGWVHALAGNLPRARQCLEAAVATLEQLDAPFFLASALEKLGRVEVRQGHFAAARKALEKALDLSRSLGHPRRGGRVWLGMGELEAASGRSDAAAESFAAALALSRRAGDALGGVDAAVALARLERRRGRLDVAQAQLETALVVVEKVRTSAGAETLRASFGASRREGHELAIDLAMERHRREPKAGHAAAALGLAERGRARALLDLLARDGVEPAEGANRELLARQRDLTTRLGTLEQRLEKLTADPAVERRWLAEQKEVVTELEQVEGRLQQEGGGALAPAPLTPAEIQNQLLDGQTALLFYALGDERSFLWVLTTDDVAVFELPARAAIEVLALEVGEQLRAPLALRRPMTPAQRERLAGDLKRAWREYQKSSRRLSYLLLGPARHLLRGKRLAIVADGGLQTLCFGALAALESPGDWRPLLADHELVYLPSASVLDLLRRQARDRQPAEKALAVFADPVFSADDPRLGGTVATPSTVSEPEEVVAALRSMSGRLRFSEGEASAAARVFAPADVRVATGFEASIPTLLDAELEGYRIVHFATHAFVHERYPQLSGLILSRFEPGGRPIEGYLRVHQVYGLRLRAELVVLSACETALGKPFAGEGLLGLVRGFFHAGAPRVIASLWRVDDAATAALMARFYHALGQGLRPAAALREAQLLAWREAPKATDRHPYAWAGFGLYGDWR